MNPQWPEARASQDSVYSFSRIREAVEWVYVDLIRSENASAWEVLTAQAPERSRIEVFDMIWWMHFPSLQPVAPAWSVLEPRPRV